LKNDYEKAMESYERVIGVDSVNAEVVFEYGEYLMKIRAYNKLIEFYLKKLDIFKVLSTENPEIFLSSVAKTYKCIGVAYKTIFENAKAKKMYEKSLEIYRELAINNPDYFLSEVAEILPKLGWVDFFMGTSTSTFIETMEESLKIFRELAFVHPEKYLIEVVRTLNDLCNKLIFAVFHGTLDKNKILEKHKEALTICIKLADENPKEYLPDLAKTYTSFGLTFENLYEFDNSIENFEKAIENYKKALKIYRELSDQNPKDYLSKLGWSLFNLGSLLLKHNDLDTFEMCEESLKIFKELAKENPKVYLHELASVLSLLGWRYDNPNAIKKYEEALIIYREFAVDYPHYFIDIYQTLYSLGSLYFITNEYEKSLKAFEEALHIFPKLPDENEKQSFGCVSGCLGSLAILYHKNQEYEKSIKFLYEENEIYKKKEESRRPLKRNFILLSFYHLFIQDYTKSELYARQSLAIDSTQVDARIKLAHSLLFQSRYPEAESIYKELLTLPAAETGKTNAQMILYDFDELEKAGVIPEDRKGEVERIRKIMNNE